MSQLVYRDAGIDDLPVIVSIYNPTIEGRMVTADTEAVTVESRIEWYRDHQPGKRPLWIVENKAQEIIGWVSFQDFYGRPAYGATAEISIYLHPNHRGYGYGKKILKHCIESCPAMGIKNLVAYIFAHNLPSLKLFEQARFDNWGLLPDVAELDGIKRSLKILGRAV